MGSFILLSMQTAVCSEQNAPPSDLLTVCCTRSLSCLQMRDPEDAGTFSWQRLADEGGLCVVGKYVDPAVTCVHVTTRF